MWPYRWTTFGNQDYAKGFPFEGLWKKVKKKIPGEHGATPFLSVLWTRVEASSAEYTHLLDYKIACRYCTMKNPFWLFFELDLAFRFFVFRFFVNLSRVIPQATWRSFVKQTKQPINSGWPDLKFRRIWVLTVFTRPTYFCFHIKITIMTFKKKWLNLI